jgi:hypothetical protein
MIMASGGDSIIVEGRSIRVSLRQMWKWIGCHDRALILNESCCIDLYCSDYLGLADLISKWCQTEWKYLPRKLRGELGQIGYNTRKARNWVSSQSPEIQKAMMKDFKLKPLKKDKPMKRSPRNARRHHRRFSDVF